MREEPTDGVKEMLHIFLHRRFSTVEERQEAYHRAMKEALRKEKSK